MYKTSQRKILHDFLESHPHGYFTVKQLAEELCARNGNISTSAIYRNLSVLVEEGIVKKYMYKSEREAYYRFIDCEACRNAIHAVCIKCGKTFHINNAVAENFQNQLEFYDGFEINKHKTTIYGLCKSCRKDRM